MRQIVLLATVSLILGLTASVVQAGGWSDDLSAGSPHGGFSTTSNKCKNCHAVHMANTGSYRLNRGNSAAEACDYCHGSTGIVATKKAWLDPFGHGTTQTSGSIVAPDDSTTTAFSAGTWGCMACHSVHGVDTIVLDGEPGITTSKLIKKSPNTVYKTYPLTYSGYNPSATSQTVTLWCTNCHEANWGLNTTTRTADGQNVFGHDSSSAGYTMAGAWTEVTPSDGINKGPKCSQCHTADGAPSTMTQKFPHAGGYDESSPTAGGERMLRAGARTTKLDFVCTGSPCHNTPSLP